MFLSKFLSVKKKTNTNSMDCDDKLGDGVMGTVPRTGDVSSPTRSGEGGATTSGSQQQQQNGDEEPFVNHRLAAWERRRAEWVASGRAGNGNGNANGNKSDRTHRRPVLSADATYDDLLTSSRPFPKPVPLVEMVDFLVEVWDEDGLYD